MPALRVDSIAWTEPSEKSPLARSGRRRGLARRTQRRVGSTRCLGVWVKVRVRVRVRVRVEGEGRRV